VTEPAPEGPRAAAPADEPDEDEPRQLPFAARLAGFVVVLVVLVGLVVVVLVRDRDRTEASGSTGATARTVPLPADNGGVITTTTAVPTPTGSGPATAPRRARDNDDIAVALEAALKRSSGFIYKASCQPAGAVDADTVLECSVASEPAVKEAPPGSVVAVVVDPQGKVVWTLGSSTDTTIGALQANPDLSCDDLAAQGRPWTAVLAYWAVNGRPERLDPSGRGRPCEGRYPSADIDQALAGAV
jgi:hypothetical protein